MGCLGGFVCGEMQGIVQERVQDFPEFVGDPVGIDGDHEADSVVAGPR